MRLAEFDHPRFRQEVISRMESRGVILEDVKKHTGVSDGTLGRLMTYQVRNIEAIFSVAYYLGLNPVDFILDARGKGGIRKRDYIFV